MHSFPESPQERTRPVSSVPDDSPAQRAARELLSRRGVQPRHVVLWDEDDPVPDNLPPGSTVTRVIWGPEPATDTPQTGDDQC